MQINGTTIAAISGGASGLGAATAKALAAQGAKVAILDRDTERGRPLADDLSGCFFDVDVTDPAQVGTQIGTRMRAEQLRILLALMVLAVCGKLAFDLLVQPSELYSLGAAGGH